MRERPILFSAPMIRALIDGTKTQTRRPIRGDVVFGPKEKLANGGSRREMRRLDWEEGRTNALKLCPYGVPGDRLWVRETWCPRSNGALRIEQIQRPFYAASEDGSKKPAIWPWRPSIHMPRWASRLTLDVTSVRVERLQDISEKAALAEGVDPYECTSGPATPDAVAAFAELWEQINAKRAPWASNPWVWVISFKRVETAQKAVSNA